MSDKSCNRCGKTGLGWDNEFYKKTGKWKLDNHRRQDGKWCNKPYEVELVKKESITLCELCSGTSFGFCTSPEKYEYHMKTMHPTDERLTELDYKIMVGMPRVYLKYWSHDPHFFKYQHLLK